MAPILPQVKNVVYLMMENRSLDNVLGWLYEGTKPKHVYPESSSPGYDGLVQGKFSNPAHSWDGVKNYPVVPVPNSLPVKERDRIPAYDPNEALSEFDTLGYNTWNGVMNQLFGDQDKITALPTPGTEAKMLGFLQDYYAHYMVEWQGKDILWAYTPGQLPRINNLALNYAVSDRWFSSVPTQTNPNRAYSICGTSEGREDNTSATAVEQYKLPTFFDYLAKNKSWGLYYEEDWLWTGKCYTDYTFPRIAAAPDGEIARMSKFMSRAQAGTLPDFTFLEAKWGFGKGSGFIQGNDYHPPTHMAPGDAFLQNVYTALRRSPQWKNLLFFVTFDEHGGTYDHVAPPWGAINPDGIRGKETGFDFNLYGVRVPTLLISPFVRPGTVFREPAKSKYPYDHTSFIKTLLLWAGVDLKSVDLGKRMPAAPTFEDVLADKVVNNVRVKATRAVAKRERPYALEVETGEGPAGSGRPLDRLFEGMPYTCSRAIIQSNDTLEGIVRAIETYHRDPEKFKASLE